MYLTHVCLFLFGCSMVLAASTNAPHIVCRRTLSEARKMYCIDSTQNIRRRKIAPIPAITHYTKALPTGNQVSNVPTRPEYNTATAEEAVASNENDYVEKCCQKPCSVTELLTDC
ncbi:hypothetical protein ACJJTC_000710 [Scirpophaga incertulas]